MILLAPRFHNGPSIIDRREPVLVTPLLPQPSIERLEGCIIRGRWATELQLHPVAVCPRIYCFRTTFWAISNGTALWQTGQLPPPLFAAPYITPLARKLPFLLRVTLGERLPWPILALGCVVLAPRAPTAMLVLVVCLLAIFGLAGGVGLPAWMDLVARVTPLRMRGKLFGWSGALSGLLGVGGGLIAERLLATWAFPYNFAACFAAASVCMLISFVALALLREPQAEEPIASVPLRAFVRQLPVLLRRDRDFSLFIVVRILGALGAMAVALVAIYATEQRGLPPSVVGRFTAAMLGTQVITTPLFGMLADRRGYKASLQFALFAQALAMALSLVVTTLGGFAVVFGLIGAATGLLFATTLNMVVEFAPSSTSPACRSA